MDKARLLDFLARKSHPNIASNAERIASKWLDHAALQGSKKAASLQHAASVSVSATRRSKKAVSCIRQKLLNASRIFFQIQSNATRATCISSALRSLTLLIRAKHDQATAAEEARRFRAAPSSLVRIASSINVRA